MYYLKPKLKKNVFLNFPNCAIFLPSYSLEPSPYSDTLSSLLWQIFVQNHFNLLVEMILNEDLSGLSEISY